VEADGSLDELRRTFLVKAFQRPSGGTAQPPCGSGLPAETIVSLTLTELDCLPVDDEGANLVRRYRERVLSLDRCIPTRLRSSTRTERV